MKTLEVQLDYKDQERTFTVKTFNYHFKDSRGVRVRSATFFTEKEMLKDLDGKIKSLGKSKYKII